MACKLNITDPLFKALVGSSEFKSFAELSEAIWKAAGNKSVFPGMVTYQDKASNKWKTKGVLFGIKRDGDEMILSVPSPKTYIKSSDMKIFGSSYGTKYDVPVSGLGEIDPSGFAVRINDKTQLSLLYLTGLLDRGKIKKLSSFRPTSGLAELEYLINKEFEILDDKLRAKDFLLGHVNFIESMLSIYDLYYNELPQEEQDKIDYSQRVRAFEERLKGIKARFGSPIEKLKEIEEEAEVEESGVYTNSFFINKNSGENGWEISKLDMMRTMHSLLIGRKLKDLEEKGRFVMVWSQDTTPDELMDPSIPRKMVFKVFRVNENNEREEVFLEFNEKNPAKSKLKYGGDGVSIPHIPFISGEAKSKLKEGDTFTIFGDNKRHAPNRKSGVRPTYKPISEVFDGEIFVDAYGKRRERMVPGTKYEKLPGAPIIIVNGFVVKHSQRALTQDIVNAIIDEMRNKDISSYLNAMFSSGLGSADTNKRIPPFKFKDGRYSIIGSRRFDITKAEFMEIPSSEYDFEFTQEDLDNPEIRKKVLERMLSYNLQAVVKSTEEKKKYRLAVKNGKVILDPDDVTYGKFVGSIYTTEQRPLIYNGKKYSIPPFVNLKIDMSPDFAANNSGVKKETLKKEELTIDGKVYPLESGMSVDDVLSVLGGMNNEFARLIARMMGSESFKWKLDNLKIEFSSDPNFVAQYNNNRIVVSYPHMLKLSKDDKDEMRRVLLEEVLHHLMSGWVDTHTDEETYNGLTQLMDIVKRKTSSLDQYVKDEINLEYRLSSMEEFLMGISDAKFMKVLDGIETRKGSKMSVLDKLIQFVRGVIEDIFNVALINAPVSAKDDLVVYALDILFNEDKYRVKVESTVKANEEVRKVSSAKNIRIRNVDSIKNEDGIVRRTENIKKITVKSPSPLGEVSINNVFFRNKILKSLDSVAATIVKKYENGFEDLISGAIVRENLFDKMMDILTLKYVNNQDSLSGLELEFLEYVINLDNEKEIKTFWFKNSEIYKAVNVKDESDEFSDYTDDGSEEKSTEEKLENQSKDSLYDDRRGDRFSSIDAAGKQARTLVRMLPKFGEMKEGHVKPSEGYNIYIDGKEYHYEYEKDIFNNVKLVDFTKTWKYIALDDMVAGATTFEQLLTALSSDNERLFKLVPEIMMIEEVLNAPSGLFAEQLRNSFWQAMRPKALHYMLVENENGFFFKDVSDNQSRYMKARMHAAFSIFYDNNKKFFKINQTSGLPEFLAKEYFKGVIDKNGDPDPSEIEDADDLFEKLGIIVSDETKETHEWRAFKTEFVRVLVSRQKDSIYSSLDIIDFTNSNITYRGTTYRGSNAYFERIAEKEAIYNPSEPSMMVLNPEGEKVSVVSNSSSILVDVKKLNTIGTREELEESIPRLKNPLAKRSITLRRMFNEEGVRNSNKFILANYSGYKNETKGVNTQGMNDREWVRTNFVTMVLFGAHMNLMPQVASTRYFMKLSQWGYGTGNMQSEPIAIDKIHDNSYIDVFLDYLEGELERIHSMKKNGERGRKNSDPNFSLFKSILGSTKEDLLKLTDGKTAPKIKDIDNALLKKVKGEIDAFINKSVTNYKKVFESVGADDVFDNPRVSEKASIFGKDTLFKHYIVNSMVLRIEESILFHGDPSIFDKFFKRSNSPQSTGSTIKLSRFFLDWINTNESFSNIYGNYTSIDQLFKSATIKDYEIDNADIMDNLIKGFVESKNETERFLGKEPSGNEELAEKVIRKKYSRNNVADGDAMFHPDFYRAYHESINNFTDEMREGHYYYMFKFAQMLGKADQEMLEFIDKIEKKIEKKGGEYWTFDKSKFQYRGNEFSGKGKTLAKEVFDKFAIMPFYPHIMWKYPAGRKMVEEMLKHGLAYVKYESGTKLDQFSPVPFVQEVDKGNSPSLEPSIHTLHTDYLKEQVKQHTEQDEDATFGSQYRKLLFYGLFNDGKYLFPEAKQYIERWRNIVKELSIIEFDKIMGEVSTYDKVNKKWGPIDKVKLAKLLEKEVGRRDMPDAVSEFFSNANFTPDTLFEESLSPQIVQNLLASIFRRITSQKLAGKTLILVSSPMFLKEGEKLGFYEYTDKNTRVRHAEAKIALTGDFKNLLNLTEVGERAKVKNISKFDALNELILEEEFYNRHQKKLRIVSYRIPTQGYNSMDVFRIKEFLPTGLGSVIIVPPQITTKGGMDFDYDKSPTIFPNIDDNGNYIDMGVLSNLSRQELMDKKRQLNAILKKLESIGKKNNAVDADELSDSDNTDADVDAVIEDKLGIQDEISKIKSLINSIKRYKKSLHNELLDISEGVLLHPFNFFKVITPNSPDIIMDELLGEDGILKKVKNERTEPADTDVFTFEANLSKIRSARLKNYLGIAAVSNSYQVITNLAQLKLSPTYMVGKTQKSVRPLLLNPKDRARIEKDGMIDMSYPFVFDKDRNMKGEINSQWINVTVDAPSDDTAGNANIRQDNFGAIMFAHHAYGYGVDKMLKLISLPIVYYYHELTDRLVNNGWSMSQASSIVLAYFYKINVTVDGRVVNPENLFYEKKSVVLHNAKDLANKISEQLEKFESNLYPDILDEMEFDDFREVSEWDFSNSPKSKALLAHYIKIIEQAKIFRGLQSGTNYDTSPAKTLFQAYEKRTNLENSLKTGLFGETTASDIERTSVVSGLNWGSDVINISTDVFRLLNHPEFVDYVVKFQIREDNVRNNEQYFRKVGNDLLFSIVQTFGDINGSSIYNQGVEILTNPDKNIYVRANEISQKLSSDPVISSSRILSLIMPSQSKIRSVPLYNFFINSGMDNSTDMTNELMEEFRMLLSHENEEVRRFAQDMAIAGFIQSGFNKGQLYVTNIIPPEFLSNTIKGAYNTFLSMPYDTIGGYVVEFHDRFMMHEPRLFYSLPKDMSTVVESYRLKDYQLDREQYTRFIENEPQSNVSTNESVIGDDEKLYDESLQPLNIYYGSNENPELSNFAFRKFTDRTEWKGVEFNTVEGAFQAAKILYSDMYSKDNGLTVAGEELLKKFQVASGADAKSLGRKVSGLNTSLWDKESSNVMRRLLIESFLQNPGSLKSLIDTGMRKITHTQDKGKWGKEFPKVLMEVRSYFNRYENYEEVESFIDYYKSIGEDERKARSQEKKSILELRNNPIQYTEGQAKALTDISELIDKNSDGYYLIAGYAGTGKTTIAENIAKYAAQAGKPVLILAPTNKAAKVLNNKLKDTGVRSKPSTIHSAIYGEPDPITGEWIVNLTANNHVIIVDESSMIDEGIMNDLIKITKGRNNTVIFMGDSFQLEQIGKDPGLFQGKVKELNGSTLLTEVKRQSLDSDILKVATVIRNDNQAYVPTESMNDFAIVKSKKEFINKFRNSILEGDDVAMIVATNSERIAMNKEARDAKFLGDKANVINIGEVLMSVANSSTYSNSEVFTVDDIAGAPEKYSLKITDNSGKMSNYDVYLVYIINEKEDQVPTLLIPELDRPSLYHAQILKAAEESSEELYGRLDPFIMENRRGVKKLSPNLTIATYGYAITAHKSQGSQWKRVFVNQNYSAPTWNPARWFYTAITRASEKVEVLPTDVNKSIDNKEIDEKLNEIVKKDDASVADTLQGSMYEASIVEEKGIDVKNYGNPLNAEGVQEVSQQLYIEFKQEDITFKSNRLETFDREEGLDPVKGYGLVIKGQPNVDLFTFKGRDGWYIVDNVSKKTLPLRETLGGLAQSKNEIAEILSNSLNYYTKGERSRIILEGIGFDFNNKSTVKIIENEMDEGYWRDLYTKNDLSNKDDFRYVEIPTIKNKFKPDFENVYHGTNKYEIDKDGNLVLTPSKNFRDKTVSISFTQIPVVAQDYMLRKNGNVIIKISNSALGDNYEIESAEEIAINGNKLFIVPKGQYEIIDVPSFSEKMRKDYERRVEEKAVELRDNAKSELDLVGRIYSARFHAMIYGEMQEYSDSETIENAPNWYVPDEYIDARAAKKAYEDIAGKINRKWIISNLSNALIDRIKETGESIANIETALNGIEEYGGVNAPYQSTLFEELLKEIGLNFSERFTGYLEGEKLEKAKQKEKEYNDIVNSIKALVEEKTEESIKFYNSPEQVKLRKERSEKEAEDARKAMEDYKSKRGLRKDKDCNDIPF